MSLIASIRAIYVGLTRAAVVVASTPPRLRPWSDSIAGFRTSGAQGRAPAKSIFKPKFSASTCLCDELDPPVREPG